GLALPGSLGAYLQHLHQSLVHGLAGLGSGSMNESVSEGLSHGTWKLPLPRKKRGEEASCLCPEKKEGKKQAASSPLRVQGTDGQGRRDQEPAEPGLVSAWPPTPARAGPWASCLVVAWNL